MRASFPGKRRGAAQSAGLAASCTFALAVAFLCLVAAPAAAETYLSAVVDSNGTLRVQTQSHKQFTPKKDPTQVGFDKPHISPDGHAVGWLALYPNCCTSYPIPLALIVASGGKQRTYRGIELPVWKWCFESQGRQIAFEQETVHGGMGIHYELHDDSTGRLLAEYEPPEGSDDLSKAPKWVRELEAKP